MLVGDFSVLQVGKRIYHNKHAGEGRGLLGCREAGAAEHF
jgi:hypothetical protein